MKAAALVAAAALRVMTYNVHSCRGLDRRVKPERVAAVIAREKPDIVCLQEVRVGKVDQPKVLADALGMTSLFFETMKVGEESYGIALLSRLPVKLVRSGPLPGGAEPRGAIWAEALVGSTTVQVLDTHLGLGAKTSEPQADALLTDQWLGAIRGPLILCGDFNSKPSGPAYRKLASRVPDAAPAAGSTFPSFLPVMRIDHVLASGLRPVEARVGAGFMASDHLPLVVDLALEAQKNPRP